MVSNQAAAQASLAGTVVDDSTQQAIADVEVRIEAIDESATTDSEGNFSFDNLQPGTHTVSVSASDYEHWSREVEVVDESKELNINLKKKSQGQEIEH